MADIDDVLKLLDNANVSGALDIVSNVKDKEKAAEVLNDYAAMLGHHTQAFDEIEKILEKSIEIDPKNPHSYYNLGCLYTEPEMLSKNPHLALWAIEKYRKAVEIDGKMVKAHFNLGLLLAYIGNPEDAWEEYDILLDLDPENTDKYGMLEGIIKSKMAE